jgi:hypothetical protein
MRSALAYIFAGILLIVGCVEKPKEVPPIAAADSKVMRFSQLPAPVRDTLMSATRDGKVPDNRLFADPGQKWNPSDVIDEDRTVPERRLIFAGTIDGNWFVYYEHGGRGKHEHLVALSLDAHNRASIWRISMHTTGGQSWHRLRTRSKIGP